MLGSVTGYLGTGKTLFLSWLAWCQRDRDIYSNYSLELDNAEEISVEDLENVSEGLVLIDEAYLWMDSRLSNSEMNRYMSKIVFQSRKRDMDIFFSSQLQRAVDLRFRHLQDFRAHALGDDSDGDFAYILQSQGRLKRIWLERETVEKVFEIFDTKEYPEEEPSKFESEAYDERVREISGELEERFDDTSKLTKNMIKDILFERGITSKQILEGVYARLKRNRLEAVS